MENPSTLIEKFTSFIKIHKRLSRLQRYFLYFLIFAFLGWIIESFYSILLLGHFTKRGFLYGPICPIYGCGAIILIIFFNQYKNKNFKLFIYATFIFSIFEYLVSYGMDALFSAKWWDYTNEFLNLNGRISIFYSIVWGIFAILFVNTIYPYFKKKLNKLLSKIPYTIQIFFIHITTSLFFIDSILSFAKNL